MWQTHHQSVKKTGHVRKRMGPVFWGTLHCSTCLYKTDPGHSFTSPALNSETEAQVKRGTSLFTSRGHRVKGTCVATSDWKPVWVAVKGNGGACHIVWKSVGERWKNSVISYGREHVWNRWLETLKCLRGDGGSYSLLVRRTEGEVLHFRKMVLASLFLGKEKWNTRTWWRDKLWTTCPFKLFLSVLVAELLQSQNQQVSWLRKVLFSPSDNVSILKILILLF